MALSASTSFFRDLSRCDKCRDHEGMCIARARGGEGGHPGKAVDVLLFYVFDVLVILF